jgi:hypothetical protein
MLSYCPPEAKENIWSCTWKFDHGRFLENQFCMFQALKRKQNLGIFKAVLNQLASYQLWLSMQISGRKYWRNPTLILPSARFSTFSRVSSVLRGCFVLLLKNMDTLVFKKILCPKRAPLSLPSPHSSCVQVFAFSLAQSAGLQLDS